MASTDLVIGLKSNIKRGFGLANHWRDNYAEAVDMLVKSWSCIEGDATSMIEPMAWKVVETYPFFIHYKERSIIKDMVIPANTYTNKKGITKTKPEERVPAHYTQDDMYIGRVSIMGEEPILYKVKARITRDNCVFNKSDGSHITDYFQPKTT